MIRISVVYLLRVTPVRSAAPYPHLLHAKATTLYSSLICLPFIIGEF
ncbi:MAG: hypothetical protein ACTSPY_02260 [Candidatus Helarchaeota archaeon]